MKNNKQHRNDKEKAVLDNTNSQASPVDNNKDATMALSKQKAGRTKEIAEAQPTLPPRRGRSTAKGNSDTTTTTNSNNEQAASGQSSFDSGKWERLVSTQEKLAEDPVPQKGDGKPAAAAKSTMPPTSTSFFSADQHDVAPLPGALTSSSSSQAGTASSTDDILPGAFRMRPSFGATSAREYDASDDYRAVQEESSRRSVMVDQSEKEETTLRNAEDILIEATLVPDETTEVPTSSASVHSGLTSRDAEAPTVVPEPELVTAHPMSIKHFDVEEGSTQRRYYRWVIAGLICVLVTFLVVAGIVLGTQASKNKDDDSDEDATPTMAPTAFTQDLLPAITQDELEDPTSPQTRAYGWLQDDLQSNQDRPNPADMNAFFPLQRFALAAFYYALQGEQWSEQDYWLEDGTDPCDWYTTFYGVICTTSNGERRRRLGEAAPRRYYQRLSLFKTGLVGTLPPEIGLLTQLDVVNLHGNDIYGSLPSELGMWQDVTLLQLFNNSLTGSLPSELGQLSQIRHLNFAFNALTGNLPTELSRLTTMEVLSVSNNWIGGRVPTEFGLLTKLEGLHLYENPELGGPLPSELGQLTKLSKLQMNGVSSLTGTIPMEFGLIASSEEIQLHNTGVSGTIPSSLGQLSKLTRLALHDTELTGTVPAEVCALVQTGVLRHVSIDCERVKCSCKCDCSLSSSLRTSDGDTEAPATIAQELITDPPITVSGEVTPAPVDDLERLTRPGQ